jgi:hypothetical protein
MTTRLWIATYFRPVSNAMFNKKPIKEVVAIWGNTKFIKEKATNRPNLNYAKKLLQGTSMAKEAYRNGWLNKSNWNIVK